MERARNISKSMMSYLKRAREQKEFLLKETNEFERGKRHLANIMGIESQQMTQADIDDAIKYLFPSGLFDKRARPMMKHPDILFKAQKDAQFDIEGRPHHYLFYTTMPNYYEALSGINKMIRDLDKHEDEQLAKGVINPSGESKYNFATREWLGIQEISDKFIERLSGEYHEYFKRSLEKLVMHPYSNLAKSLIEEYSKLLPEQSIGLELPELLRNEETGEIYTDVLSRRREHRVQVKTILNGSGKIANMQDKVDIIAKIVMRPSSVGPSAVAGAIRHAVSCSIAAYVDKEKRERLRLAGLLTLDRRIRMRKMFGQEGARRKYTWKKR